MGFGDGLKHAGGVVVRKTIKLTLPHTKRQEEMFIEFTGIVHKIVT